VVHDVDRKASSLDRKLFQGPLSHPVSGYGKDPGRSVNRRNPLEFLLRRFRGDRLAL
jgi:hypothetical protein